MRILIIDNNIDSDCWGAADLRHSIQIASGASVTLCTRRAPERDLPSSPASFDRIIASGSRTSALQDGPWITELEEFVRRALDLGKPYLGICYGHQLLGRALGGKSSVRKSPTPEYGWTKIKVTSTNPLLGDLGEEFHSFSSHSDEVHALPPGTQAFATSERCAVQGFAVTGKPAFGIQFHPEKTLEGAEKIFAEERAAGRGRILLHPREGAKYYDTQVASAIFKNFLALE